jgi:TRAP-type C4-dicarboxylate transport system permease small subunit
MFKGGSRHSWTTAYCCRQVGHLEKTWSLDRVSKRASILLRIITCLNCWSFATPRKLRIIWRWSSESRYFALFALLGELADKFSRGWMESGSWIFGGISSSVGLIFQIFLYILVQELSRRCRKTCNWIFWHFSSYENFFINGGSLVLRFEVF